MRFISEWIGFHDDARGKSFNQWKSMYFGVSDENISPKTIELRFTKQHIRATMRPELRLRCETMWTSSWEWTSCNLGQETLRERKKNQSDRGQYFRVRGPAASSSAHDIGRVNRKVSNRSMTLVFIWKIISHGLNSGCVEENDKILD